MVASVNRCGGGGDRGRVSAVAQKHRHIRHHAITRIITAAVVRVEVHQIANRSGEVAIESEVHCGNAAGKAGDINRIRGCDRKGIAPEIGCWALKAANHGIIQAERQVAERIIATSVSHRCAHIVAFCIPQLDGDIGNPRFPDFPGSVIVQILENLVSDGSRATGAVAPVSGQIDLIQSKGFCGSLCHRAAVRVRSEGVSRRHPAGARSWHGHLVITRHKVCELVSATCIGCGSGQNIIAAAHNSVCPEIGERNCHARQPFFTCILGAVAIPVTENRVTNAPPTHRNWGERARGDNLAFVIHGNGVPVGAGSLGAGDDSRHGNDKRFSRQDSL